MTYARQISVFILFAFANDLSAAADIYRWVDESGRTHVSDVVPQAYKGKAERIDTGPSQISPEDQQAAQRRVEQERRLLQQREREAASTSQRLSPAAVPKAGAMSPPLQSLENPVCAEKWRAYRESQECFAPFMRGARTRHGHRRPAHLSEEAYRYCTPVADPSAECPIPVERR